MNTEYFRGLDSANKSLLLLLNEEVATDKLQKASGLCRSATLKRMQIFVKMGVVSKVKRKYNRAVGFVYSLKLTLADRLNLAKGISAGNLSTEIQSGVLVVAMASDIKKLKDRVNALETRL